MSFEDAMAVRSSDVYEYKGLAKPLLTLMYQLIERAEEDEEPSEHEGTAWASQRYLAAQLGCSESQVRKLIQRFHLDGWLLIEEKRDAFGHPHYSYKPPDNALKRLTDHKMKMNGRKFARAKVPQQARAEHWRKNLHNQQVYELLDVSGDSGGLRGDNGNPNGGAMANPSRRPAVEPYGEPPASSTAARPHPSRRSAVTGVGGVQSTSSSMSGNQAVKPTSTSTATPKPTPTTSGTPSPIPSRGVYGNSRTHPAPRGKAVAPLHSGDSAARAAFEDPQDEGIREYLASLSPADKAKLERTRERERKETARQARIARELRVLEGRDLSQLED